MWFRDVVDGFQFVYCCFGGFIIDCGIVQFVEMLDFMVEQFFNVWLVVWLVDVYGVGQCCLGGFWCLFVVLQIVWNGVVGVGGGDKVFDWQFQ